MFKRNCIPGLACRVLVSVALSACLLFHDTASAATVACAKNVTVDLLHNGIVAPGAATASCLVGPVWPQVAPVQMQPGDSTPDGYLYAAFRTGTNRLLIGVDVGGDQDLSDQDSVALIFDADNSNNFTNGDFYIQVKAIPGATTISSGTACTQATGELTYFQFDGGNWQEVTGDDLNAIRAAVNTKIAYRYELGIKVWNMEIDMPKSLAVGLKTYFNFNATSFGMGAYFFVATGHHNGAGDPEQGTVLRWPDTLAPRGISDQVLVQLPASKVLDPNTFADLGVGDTCLDVNFLTATPVWEINGSPANENDHRIKRPPQDNTYSVRYHYKGPGTTQSNSPNSGIIELSLTPYRAGVGVGTPWVKSQPTTVNQFNTDTKVDIQFPNSERPSAWTTFEQANGQISFVCATMKLKSFTHNDDTSNDSHNVNHNYFATSDYKHQFFLSGDDLPDLKPGETGALFLRLEGMNDPESNKPAAPARLFQRADGLMWLLLGVVLLGLLAWFILRHRSPTLARLAVILVLLILVIFVVRSCKQQPPIGTGRWQIPNAGELGLKPVKGDATLYEMPIAKGQIKRVDLQFTGHPLPYQTERSELRPATENGEPNIQRIPVRPGGVVTVIAFGEVDLDGPDGSLPPTSATGMVIPEEPAPTAAVGRQTFLLQRGYYTPKQYAGALIGSFDGFEHSFVIGRNTSIVVPQGAETLSVAVNGVLGAYRAMTGAFQLFIIGTELPPVPTHTLNPGDATGHVPPSIDTWRVLTSLNIYSYYRTPVTEPGGGIRSQTLHPLGAAHYSIYESHVR
jgi:hypothetical protein